MLNQDNRKYQILCLSAEIHLIILGIRKVSVKFSILCPYKLAVMFDC